MAVIDNLIKKNRSDQAIKALEEAIEIAEKYDFEDYVDHAMEKLNRCKENIIKKTILNYSTKLTRLELVDLSEKIDIHDEILLEKTIHEMIKNQEINAEYFSNSKSIAFFHKDKQDKHIVPTSKKKDIKKLRVFLSYSTLDAEYFKIADIAKKLEIYPEIKKTLYWQTESKEIEEDFTENTLKNTDVFVLFCSKNLVKSNTVKDEWQAAFQVREKEELKIVPVYDDENDVPVLLLQLLNVKFDKDNFDGFIADLYEEILR